VPRLLCGVYGDLGSGKTLFLTYLALKNHKKIPVYANYRIDLPNCYLIEPSDLVSMQYDKALILLDEAYTWLESRVSGSKLNRYVSYVIFQSRKRGLDFVLSAQLSITLDIRFRELCDLFVLANRHKQGFRYLLLTKSLRMKSFLLPYDYAEKKLFKIYDTYEIVKPFEQEDLSVEVSILSNPKKANQIIDEIVNEIKGRVKGKITHAQVMDYLLRLEKPLSLEPFVYARLKELLGQ